MCKIASWCFGGCSNVVESRVEHPILDAESRRNAAFTSDSEQPRRVSPWGTRGLLTTTHRGEPVFISTGWATCQSIVTNASALSRVFICEPPVCLTHNLMAMARPAL